MTTTTEIWGFDVVPQVGRWVKPDGWTCGERLIEGDSFTALRLSTGDVLGGPIQSLAVRVEVTGRTLQRFQGLRVVRVKITFVGDGDPDVITHGWMEVPW